MDEMVFRRAEEDDAVRIGTIIRQAKERMRLRGSLQWQDGYPAPDDIARDIETGCGYVLCAEEEIVAYGAVLFAGEPAYAQIDGAWLNDRPYAVVHRLAVADGMTRRGVGTLFMRKVEALALRAGVSDVRADTNFDNPCMQKILVRMGFLLCGQVQYMGASRLAYHKPLI